jgi:hypothetical protein
VSIKFKKEILRAFVFDELKVSLISNNSLCHSGTVSGKLPPENICVILSDEHDITYDNISPNICLCIWQ